MNFGFVQQALVKVTREARIGSPGSIPMIQAPFCSSSVDLHHSTGMFFCQAVPELNTVENTTVFGGFVLSFFYIKILS